jgi:hypothetical protein
MSIQVLAFVLALLAAGALAEFGLAALLVALWRRWVGELVEGDVRLTAEEHRELLAVAVQRQAAKWSGGIRPEPEPEAAAARIDEVVGGGARVEVVGRRTPTLATRPRRNARHNP